MIYIFDTMLGNVLLIGYEVWYTVSEQSMLVLMQYIV